MKWLIIQLTTEITNAPIIAAVNEETEKPAIRVATIQKNTPFRIIENKPSVRILIGSVRILTIGFTTRLIKTRHADTIRAVTIPLTEIPVTK